MFVDRIIVSFSAGKGGDGCLSFRREKFIPRGGPDGGNGGKGGDIILYSCRKKESLVDLQYHRQIKAENGGHGGSANKTGASGRNTVVHLPAGAVVKTYPEGRLIFDFAEEGLSLLIARGGRGGRGNTAFKTATNRAPRRFEKGQQGESIKVQIELKLIAQAGLVGLPNAGKSTLLGKISNARPKTGPYPFTTLIPHLGVLEHRERRLVIADIPGIIANAHLGEGMGLDFLRHIERTRSLVFLLDGSKEARITPVKALRLLEKELHCHQPALMQKKAMVVINKIDLLGPGERKKTAWLRRDCARRNRPCIEISALTGKNIDTFKETLLAINE